jgi:alpha-glucosidase
MHTRAHAAALFVAFESQLRMVADSPDAYDGQKELELLQAVPSCWDETRILKSVPSQYITIARRRGNEWFAGSVTDWDARPFDVPLSFPGSGAYQAEIHSDGPNAAAQPKGSVLERRRVDGPEAQACAGRRQRHTAGLRRAHADQTSRRLPGRAVW